MSGAGKSTLADAARARLEDAGYFVIMLDGDAVRQTTSQDLGFSAEDIIENNARIVNACASKRSEADAILVPVIAPFESARASARSVLSPGYAEIYVSAPLSVLRERDVKGLYARERKGEIDNLIGVSPNAPYEVPRSPDLHIDTASETPETSIDRLVRFIDTRLGADRR